MSNVPVVSVVGWSNTGKTTFLENLINELKNRGYRVGTIKHHPGNIELDRPGKDTYRHAQAGAEAVIIASPQKIGLVRQTQTEWSLQQMTNLMDDMDIIIVEGFKREPTLKIEVYREGFSTGPVAKPEHLIALVSDTVLEADVPVFNWPEAQGVADLLEEKFLR
jgi:molybdopterin-guanine dinucleotide biosynthesis protein B